MKKLLDHLHKIAKYLVYFKYTHLCWSHTSDDDMETMEIVSLQASTNN